jgi:hypothetical protein
MVVAGSAESILVMFINVVDSFTGWIQIIFVIYCSYVQD